MDNEQTVPQGMRESTPVERILDLAFEPSSRKQESPGFSRGECQGFRHCNKCHSDLPESEFGTNPMLKAPFTICRSCFAEEAKTLAYRLEWYIRRWRDHDERDAIPPAFPMNLPDERHSLEMWLVENAERPDGVKVAQYARNISTPGEEVDRLINMGKLDPIDITPGAAEVEKDPYGGFKARYRHMVGA